MVSGWWLGNVAENFFIADASGLFLHNSLAYNSSYFKITKKDPEGSHFYFDLGL